MKNMGLRRIGQLGLSSRDSLIDRGNIGFINEGKIFGSLMVTRY